MSNYSIYRGIVLLLLIFLINSSILFAQDTVALHQYQQKYKTATDDTSRVNFLRKAANFYTDVDSSIVITKQALTLANNIKWTKGIAQCCLNLGSFFLQKSEYDSSLKYSNLALQAAIIVGDKNRIALIYINRGTLYTTISKYEQALSDLKNAVRLSEKTNNEDRLARASLSISQLYMYQENWDAALPWAEKALELQTKLGNEQQVANCKLNLGGLYMKQKNYQLAEKTLLEVLAISEKKNDYVNIANSTMSLGDLYQETGRLQDAILSLKKSVHASSISENDHLSASGYYNLGNTYMLANLYEPALESYEKGLSAIKGKAEFQYEQYLIYEGLAKAYFHLRDYKSGYEALERFTILKDSVNQRLQNKKLLELQTQFETEQKDKEIVLLSKRQLQQEEAVRQRELKNVFIGGAVLLLLIAGLLLNRYQIKQRAAKELSEKNKMIEEARQRAEKSEQFKSQFLANMSHEIRTPMNAVMGMTNLLLDEPQNEKNLRYLNIIKNASENLLVVINDILDLSKMEAGKMQLEKIPFRIREVLNSIHDTLQFKAEEKGLIFITDIDDDIPSVLKGDPARLTQVLLNLAGNAVKFTEKGSVTVEVKSEKSIVKEEVSESSHHSLLTFHLSDTGIGIPQEQLDKIFESFAQVHAGNARRYGGTGLGLTISKELVELFGGKLEAESQPGAGSVFSFTVPFEISSEEEYENYFLQKEGFSADDLFGLKILLAEDNEHNQLVVVDTLKKMIEEVEIVVVNNGKEVIELLGHMTEDERLKTDANQSSVLHPSSYFDLILMDVQMPELDGYETARQIRDPKSAIPNHNIPIIALTASVVRSDLKKCIEAGMNSYIPKPFKKEDLVREIGKVLERNTNSEIHTHAGEFSSKSLPKITQSISGSTNGISFINLYQVSSDNTEKMKEYLFQFVELVPSRIAQLKSACEIMDRENIYHAAHKLKPQLGFFGLKKEELIANTIEVKANDISLNELEPLIVQLEEGCNLATYEIKQEIIRIS